MLSLRACHNADMRQSRSRFDVITGIALIALPLVAWGFKLMSMGWMILIIIMGPILALLIGYVLQIVIASQGFLSARALFAGVGRRPGIAAWATSVGIVLFGVFMPDGGDVGYGSTLQVWLGSYGPNAEAVHAATDGLNGVLAFASAAVWLGGFVWLVVEWIMALVRRRRARLGAGEVSSS